MIDCYRILGVSPHASQAEIRAAYIARMKVLHPDASSGPAGSAEAEASEISAAYWQLRTDDRRAEHDRQLFAPIRLAAPVSGLGASPRRHPGLAARAPKPMRGPRERGSSVLVGVAVGMVLIALAAPAGLFWMAHLYPLEAARARATPVIAAPPEPRRPLDAGMRTAAADDFATVVRDFGLAGAQAFSSRCLAELPARASMTMLDYCIAFDDAAATWERSRRVAPDRERSRLFTSGQRSGAYRVIAEQVQEPEVRNAMLQEARHFEGVPTAIAEATSEFFGLSASSSH
jgi:curved DNA-binding protein CbpA